MDYALSPLGVAICVSMSPLWSSQCSTKGTTENREWECTGWNFQQGVEIKRVFAFDPVVLNDIHCFAYLKLRTSTILHIQVRVNVQAYSIWHHTPSLTGSEASTRSMKFSLRSCQLVNGGKMTTPSKQSRRSLFVFILCLLVLGTINIYKWRIQMDSYLFLRNLFGI